MRFLQYQIPWGVGKGNSAELIQKRMLVNIKLLCTGFGDWKYSSTVIVCPWENKIGCKENGNTIFSKLLWKSLGQWSCLMGIKEKHPGCCWPIADIYMKSKKLWVCGMAGAWCLSWGHLLLFWEDSEKAATSLGRMQPARGFMGCRRAHALDFSPCRPLLFHLAAYLVWAQPTQHIWVSGFSIQTELEETSEWEC